MQEDACLFVFMKGRDACDDRGMILVMNKMLGLKDL